MALLKKFADLGNERHIPCQEYPGSWLVFADGKEVAKRQTFEDALSCADAVWQADIDKVSVCWMASDNDPRWGQTWFTPFYQHGVIDSFGQYKS